MEDNQDPKVWHKTEAWVAFFALGKLKAAAFNYLMAACHSSPLCQARAVQLAGSRLLATRAHALWHGPSTSSLKALHDKADFLCSHAKNPHK